MCRDCGCNKCVVEVNAGPHERNNVLVSLPCHPGECPHGHSVRPIDANGDEGAPLLSQCITSALPTVSGSAGELVWCIDHLAAGETARFAIGPDENEPGTEGVSVEIKDGRQADFTIEGELFTSYIVKPGIARPFCYPVIGPGGLNIVRDIVYLPEGEHGSTYNGIDHVHHKGIWVAQGDANGTDNWSETEGHGRTINRELTVESQGPLFAQLHAANDWVHANGSKIMEEDTFIRVYNTPNTARIVDFSTVWMASEGGVFFGDTKEAGTVSVRLKESMEERYGGTIRNSFGALGEAENWGRPAPWVDYYGPLEDRVCGITIMDHATNLRYPTTWHVRSYGLFTANQWGLHDFTGDFSKRGDYVLPAGHSLCFRFRLYIHENDTVAADVSGRYLDWIFPPQVADSG